MKDRSGSSFRKQRGVVWWVVAIIIAVVVAVVAAVAVATSSPSSPVAGTPPPGCFSSGHSVQDFYPERGKLLQWAMRSRREDRVVHRLV
jgi:hypothetical protein